MEKIRLIGRNSRLSLLQIERVREKIMLAYPELQVEIISRTSKGDDLSAVPLQSIEGSDFFTKEIFDALSTSEADIAVHSLKDMSYEHFSGSNVFAVIEREDVRDIALFSKETIAKLINKDPVIVGTCSPRREEMATGFLEKALPYGAQIETRFIRGNVDTRLRKLDAGEYDGIILATAGLNRLLSNDETAASVRTLLQDKLLMLLPLVECVPAPCQGAIVAEAHPGNKKAITILEKINDEGLLKECKNEKEKAIQYGAGCLQKFGVTTIHYGKEQVLFAAGKDAGGKAFSDWDPLPELNLEGKTFFSSADYMGSFFEYDYKKDVASINESIVYVANYKAIVPEEIIAQLKTKYVWAAGTKTWFELAKKGIWVQGSADAFGLDFLNAAWEMNLFRISKDKVCILTNHEAESNWRERGWKTTSTYSLRSVQRPELREKLEAADAIFWTSFRQYDLYKDVLKAGVIHLCPSGETANLLRDAALDPIVFPTIKAYQQWKKTFSRSRNVA